MRLLIAMIMLSLGLTLVKNDISMYGIKINDSSSILDSITLNVEGKEIRDKYSMIRYRTENGNDFSLTSSEGKIVYMENDWLQNKVNRQPLLTDFIFGSTTLEEIYDTFETKGFVYNNNDSFNTGTEIISFNCFMVESSNNEILVLVTKIPLSDSNNENNLDMEMKLDAIILSNVFYLDEIWGEEKRFSEDYKLIKL